eukprot:5034915-Prymnesium_polylepis.1
MGCRCFWDADTDNYAEDTYRNVRARALRSCHPADCARRTLTCHEVGVSQGLTCALLCVRRIRSSASQPLSVPTSTDTPVRFTQACGAAWASRHGLS